MKTSGLLQSKSEVTYFAWDPKYSWFLENSKTRIYFLNKVYVNYSIIVR